MYDLIEVPKPSSKVISPYERKYFFTLPAPAKCAAAKIPDSVTFTPFMYLPLNLLMSLRKIHLLTLHKAIKAFSCNSGDFKNLSVS